MKLRLPFPFQKIPDGPEMDDYKEKRKAFDQDFANILATISGGSNIDVIQLDIEGPKIEELLDEAVNTVERKTFYSVIKCFVSRGSIVF